MQVPQLQREAENLPVLLGWWGSPANPDPRSQGASTRAGTAAQELCTVNPVLSSPGQLQRLLPPLGRARHPSCPWGSQWHRLRWEGNVSPWFPPLWNPGLPCWTSARSELWFGSVTHAFHTTFNFEKFNLLLFQTLVIWFKRPSTSVLSTVYITKAHYWFTRAILLSFPFSCELPYQWSHNTTAMGDTTAIVISLSSVQDNQDHVYASRKLFHLGRSFAKKIGCLKYHFRISFDLLQIRFLVWV